MWSAHGQPALLHFTYRSETEPRRMGLGSANWFARALTFSGITGLGMGTFSLRLL